MRLRPYQQDLKDRILAAWDGGAGSVLGVMPTGAGKTVLFSSILNDHPGESVAIAHRREILGQICMALAKNEVPHQILAPGSAVRDFGDWQRQELGRSWVTPGARCTVASVDTLIARADRLQSWARGITLWVQDEAHHVLASNKWGKAADLFPRAKGLGVTATPTRSDRKSLARGEGGVFDALEIGPGMRELIEAGHLADYRIFAPLSDIDTSRVRVTSGGDFNREQLAKAARESHIVGDVVGHYLKLTPGRPGVTFATDVETARALAKSFTDAGVPARALSAKSNAADRRDALRDFREGRLLQLVNVDLFGEGFDLPKLEVVSMARPTASFGLYCQQFGRALRPSPGKEAGIIIDHVGNVMRHGLPDRGIVWDLSAPDTAPSRKDPPIRTCLECLQIWEGYARTCPFCGHIAEPAERSTPAQVEGDLAELSPEVLEAMRAEVDRIDGPPVVPQGLAPLAAAGVKKQHRLRQEAQEELRDTMALFGGHLRDQGLDRQAAQIRFFRQFGVDVLTAQALGRPAAEALTQQIKREL